MDNTKVLTVSIEQDENGWLTVESEQLPDLLIFTKESLESLLRSLPEKIKAIYKDDKTGANNPFGRGHHFTPKIRAELEYDHWR